MGAVKNAMQRDSLDPSIMDLDHDKSVASQLQEDEEEDEEEAPVDDGPPLKEDPKYRYVSLTPLCCLVYLNVLLTVIVGFDCQHSKYFKMLKMVSSRCCSQLFHTNRANPISHLCHCRVFR